jgi:rRNA-processing protein FCF1|tara:strand:+ start:22 stop:390 length:369 start_codon:yes stop_codon:yes gene_type:complete
LVNVISDTSFLIHFATHRIKNIDSIETDIGPLLFIVPKIVKKELEHLSGDPDKKIISEQTLDFIKNFKTNEIDGNDADSAILDYIEENRSIVATMDKELKNKIKQSGSSVLSIHNDKIILEN